MEAILHEPKLWITLAFILFMAGFIRYALPFILRALDARSQRIRDELAEAMRLREQAQAMLAEYQKKQKDMLAEAEAILQRAEVETEAMREQAQRDLQEAIERRTKQAHDKIARAEAEAMADLQSRMVDISVAASRYLLREQLDDASRDDLIDRALKDVRRIVH